MNLIWDMILLSKPRLTCTRNSASSAEKAMLIWSKQNLETEQAKKYP
jgi:hypothetical protein